MAVWYINDNERINHYDEYRARHIILPLPMAVTQGNLAGFALPDYELDHLLSDYDTTTEDEIQLRRNNAAAKRSLEQVNRILGDFDESEAKRVKRAGADSKDVCVQQPSPASAAVALPKMGRRAGYPCVEVLEGYMEFADEDRM
jgi:hypothetical protein